MSNKTMTKDRRELTIKEKKLIKYGIENLCSKYVYKHDIRWGMKRWYCDAFDCDCVMYNKELTKSWCTRFEMTVLPQMPELQRLLEDRYKQCVVCGEYFTAHGRVNTCSEKCRDERAREKAKMRQRKRRDKKNG